MTYRRRACRVASGIAVKAILHGLLEQSLRLSVCAAACTQRSVKAPNDLVGDGSGRETLIDGGQQLWTLHRRRGLLSSLRLGVVDPVDLKGLGHEPGIVLARNVMQVSHRGPHVRVPHPLLYATNIHLGDHARAESVSKVVEAQGRKPARFSAAS